MTFLVMLQRGAFGMIYAASDTAIMRTLPAADRSMGAGLHNMHRGIAMAFGVALCSVVLEKRLALGIPVERDKLPSIAYSEELIFSMSATL